MLDVIWLKRERENFREMNILILNFDWWTRRRERGGAEIKADTRGVKTRPAQSWETINEGINQSNRAGSFTI